jgi:hypothetical protein
MSGAAQQKLLAPTEACMRDGFIIANFRHVADGLQEGQFAVGERKRAARLDDLDPIYRRLIGRPITQTLGITGPDGRPSLTPMWFDYEDDRILVNTASHRPKCQWIRKNPRLTSLMVNPDNRDHSMFGWLHLTIPPAPAMFAQLLAITLTTISSSCSSSRPACRGWPGP